MARDELHEEAARSDSNSRRRTLVVAPDKFRGSLTAPQVVGAVRAAAEPLGWQVVGLPMADGGEGMLDAFGGSNRVSIVTGPGGTPVEAAWRLDTGGLAVIECATACGLSLAGGKESNDPVKATSRGVGELVAEAVVAGARRVVVGLGGSAMTDGGFDAVEAVLEGLHGERPLDRGVELQVACDVRTVLVDAARVFGPQKGASPSQIEQLSGRLRDVEAHYLSRFGADLAARGIDLPTLEGGGAAGGLGAGLVVLGGELVPGFGLVAHEVGLFDALAKADAVVTGEGALDAESFNGKVVGGVVEAGRSHGVRIMVLAGMVSPDVPSHHLDGVLVVDLSARFGVNASWRDTAGCIAAVVMEKLPKAR